MANLGVFLVIGNYNILQNIDMPLTWSIMGHSISDTQNLDDLLIPDFLDCSSLFLKACIYADRCIKRAETKNKMYQDCTDYSRFSGLLVITLKKYVEKITKCISIQIPTHPTEKNYKINKSLFIKEDFCPSVQKNRFGIQFLDS